MANTPRSALKRVRTVEMSVDPFTVRRVRRKPSIGPAEWLAKRC
jgi:hypothetical protein